LLLFATFYRSANIPIHLFPRKCVNHVMTQTTGSPVWLIETNLWWKFWLCSNHLAFFENKKSHILSVIFSVGKGLALAKHCLSCIFTINLFWRESMAMQGAKNIAKNLLLCWQLLMYLIKTSNARPCNYGEIKCFERLELYYIDGSDEFWCLFSVCLCMFDVYSLCLKTTIWHFLTFCGTRSVFIGEHKFTFMSKQQILLFTVRAGLTIGLLWWFFMF